jgi:hypothetical protein
MKKLITAAVIMMALTSCKMYDWHHNYTGQEERELTPSMKKALQMEKQKENETK